MSMLSVQCDSLRERAKVLEQGRWSDGPDDAAMMREAAWTIELLRDRLQDSTPGGKTCEWVPVESCHDFAGPGWECSVCGHEVGEYEHDFYNCCPVCCSEVREPKEDAR